MAFSRLSQHVDVTLAQSPAGTGTMGEGVGCSAGITWAVTTAAYIQGQDSHCETMSCCFC